VGAAGDRPARDELESAFRALRGGLSGVVPFADLVGRTDLTLLAAVLAECAAVVSNDSGAMHVAGAVGTPVVAIFGPTDERATAPLGEHTIVSASVFCRPCHLRTCPIDHRCMRRVTPARVLEAVHAYLAHGGRA
jgi:heptosyltransferase-2